MAQHEQRRLGIDLGGTKIEAIVLGDDGAILWRERTPSPRNDYDAIVAAVGTLITRARTDTGLTHDVPVGIGTPGAISLSTGMMKNCNSTCLNGRPLPRDLERHLGAPVRMANDADCFTLSEASDGAAAGARSVFGVIIGTGVGGGICYEGRLLSGINSICGEWGHNTLPVHALITNDPALPPPEAHEHLCYCGRYDCVEQWLSGPAFERDYLALTGRSLQARDIEAAADAGDDPAVALIERYCNLLALGLATVINIVDPEAIVLGGGMSNTGIIYQRLPDYLPRYVFSDEVRTRVLPALHGDSSGVRGAAWLWAPGDRRALTG